MKTENLLHLTFLLIIYYIIAITAEDVNTTSGIVRGHTINVLDKEINEFLNIPYAKPPIGKLRFARPELFERKNSVRIMLIINLKLIIIFVLLKGCN